MTATTPETIKREDDKLYVTDAELIRRMGVPERIARVTLRMLDSKDPAFPKKYKIWGNRRYWPAVKAYLDRTNGVDSGLGAARVAPERPARTGLPRHQPHAEPMRRGKPQ